MEVTLDSKENAVLDFLLGLGSSLDWVTPIFFFLQDLFKGPIADFGIDAYSGWNEYNLKKLLKHYGISVWGLTYTLRGDILIFTVSKKDAANTYTLLSNAGIPMIYVPDEIEIY